jgi:hypothetical protein
MSRLTYWLEQHQAPCSWKSTFGVECPGCGMQSAFIELLKSHLVECIRIYPALIPMLALFIFLALHLIFNFRKGALTIKILFIFTASVMFIHFFYKILTV